MNAEEVLAHYGVKGMKWGVRRGSQDVTLKTTPGKKVQAKGGRGQPVSNDAKEAATSRQKAKASTTDALSNKELQSLVTRMNLEQQYSRLSTDKRSSGKSLVGRFLSEFGMVKVFDYASEAAELNPALMPVVKSLKVVLKRN